MAQPLFWCVCLWLAWWLRLPGLFANTFHADEALFASFARNIAVWRDLLLQTQPVDKPPLLFYLQALFYPVFGPVGWAARMPNFIASLLLVPLTAVLARSLYHSDRVAAFTALLLTLSPLAIQFSATAYTDPLLLFWLTAALTLLTTSRRRSGARWSGFFWGLALATKYQAVFYLPLLLGMGWIDGRSREQWRDWTVGAFLPLAVLATWVGARAGGTALWSAQLQNFGGLRWSFSWELWSRLMGWVELLRYLLPWPLGLTLILYFVYVFQRRRPWGDLRERNVDLLLALFTAAYLIFHWLFAVPVWDRYLLLLLPPLLILAGRLLGHLPQKPVVWGAILVTALLWLWMASLPARAGKLPIGGSPGADGGAGEVAQVLVDAPYGTVLYDHWYSWQWRYHLFDRRVYLSWFPHADALITDLQVFSGGDGDRYIALPVGETAVPLQRRLNDAGFVLSPVRTAGTIQLFLITPERAVP